MVLARLRAWFVGVAVWIGASVAAAQPAEVVPSAEGFLGTWRVLALGAAPLGADAEPRALTDAVANADAPPRGTVLVSDRAVVDLEDLLPERTGVAYLGVRVRAERDVTLHWLLSAVGSVSVRVDGREVAAHDAPELRPDETLTTLALARGVHDVVLRLVRRPPPDPNHPPRWTFRVRMLDANERPGLGGARLELGNVDPEARAALVARAVRVEESRAIGASGLRIDVRASLPAGGLAVPVTISWSDGNTADAAPVSLAPERGMWRGEAARAFDAPARGDLTAAIRIAAPIREVRVGERIGSDRTVAAAAIALRAVLAQAPAASRAPAAWRVAELERIVAERDNDGLWRSTIANDARRLARAIAAGRDPFADPRGYQRMAFFSRLDGTPQPYELFVPTGYRARGSTRAWPLVITLHGFKGNAGDYFRNTFGLARGRESLEAHGRHGPPPTTGPMFVIAPTGRGQAMYRQAGEEDVLEALADARARFRIDPARIYITGGSMGGTGAAYIPFRYPHLFAASAALAGYHDQRVREDTNHGALNEWERFLQAERSDVDWAWNGQHLPMLLVRGTEDRPLEWTRRLVERCAQLRHRCEHREPELGHNVWTETYANGAIFDWFGPHRRPGDPRRIRFRTARERHNRAWWIEVVERSAPDVFAEVEASRADDDVWTITVRNATALTLHPRSETAAPFTARVDGEVIQGTPPLHLRREGSRWRAVASHDRRGRKRPGVSGPIRDVFHEPLVFVVGTQDPAHTWINRAVARAWARPRGWDVAYPIVDDTAVTPEMIRDETLVLVGPPRSNALHQRWAARLPVRFDRGAIVLAGRRHEAAHAGTAYVYPNPDAPDRSLLILAGVTPLGTWRALSLPDILPDYVIYDERVAPARDQWAASGTGATYREAGLFGMDWSAR